jgi:hypothetical protein
MGLQFYIFILAPFLNMGLISENFTLGKIPEDVILLHTEVRRG